MALILKSEFKISTDAKKIYVTDKTGAYDVTTNPGGWGSPNVDIFNSCLVCLVVRKASTGNELFPGISPVVPFLYDNSLLNTDEVTFEIKYVIDGTHDIYLIRMPVSPDLTNYAEGGTIQEGDYFYYDGKLYKRESGLDVEITDYLDLIEVSALNRDICEDLSTPLLAIKAQSMYKDYTLERKKNCDDAEPLFQELQKLNEDIRGLYYTFWSGLTVQAQNQIEDLLDKYEIQPNE